MMQLQALGQVMLTQGLGGGMDSMYPRPSTANGSRDSSFDTTANLYSLLVMERLTMPKHLVRKGDRGYVEVDADYDWTTYSPRNNVYWDPSFVADLDRLSNVSYAHMPLTGRRVEDQWRTSMSSDFLLFGSRSPRRHRDDRFGHVSQREVERTGALRRRARRVPAVHRWIQPTFAIRPRQPVHHR